MYAFMYWYDCFSSCGWKDFLVSIVTLGNSRDGFLLRPISIIIFGMKILYVCRLKVVFISIEGRKCGGM